MTIGAGVGVEVELKFRIDDLDRIRDAVRGLGGIPGPSIEQVDVYFAHPMRDFAVTDEALRLRTVGDSACLTYKGPLLDCDTKSREETEISFAAGSTDAGRVSHVFERLGFKPVRSVEKIREPWTLPWQGRAVEVAFDRVSGLGTFVELETTASHAQFAEAKAVLFDLAKRLELRDSERRSYLALLLESDRG